jgi:tetratricopeptide (TPR) repeat protein
MRANPRARSASPRFCLALLLVIAAAAVGVRAAESDTDAASPAKKLDRRAVQPDPVDDPVPGAAPVVSVAEARRLADAKRFGDAARVLREVLALNPENDDARSLLARVLAWDGKYEESKAEYRKILREHPDDPFERAGYARVLAWSGRHQEALRQYGRLARVDSTDFETRLGYARTLSWAGDLPGASMEYRKILAARPEYGDAWLGYATVARWRGSPTASERFLGRAAAHGADPEGLEEERAAVRRATAFSLGAGWTTAHERQYVEAQPDFVIESTGPYALARGTIGAVGVGVRAARLAQFEVNQGPSLGGTTLDYDVDMTVLRGDVSLLRGYPFQAAAGVESRRLTAGSPNVLYPLSPDDDFTGWNARAWWYAGRWTPALSARREFLAIKSTTGTPRLLAGDQTVVAGDLGYQWNARGAASVGIERARYSDENERGTVRAGAAWRLRLGRPAATIDYGLSVTDFDSSSTSYFTPLESVRHAAGIGLTGYSERAAMDYGARVQLSLVNSSNFGDIVTSTWSGYLNLTAFDAIPLGLEGSYSRDNNAYETWFLGVAASARW